MLLIAACFVAFVYAELRFANVHIYGADRAVLHGVGPSTSCMTIESPPRYSVRRSDGLASAAIKINSSGKYVANYYNGATVGLVRKGKLEHPDNMRNNERDLSTRGHEDMDIGKAYAGDIVVLYVPHTTRFQIERTQFYKAFNGREDHSLEKLVTHFYDRYTTNEVQTRRFTLLVAQVVKAKDAINRHMNLISGGEAIDSSDDVNENAGASLSFTPTSHGVSSHMISPGATPSSNSGYTPVNSQGTSASVFQPQQPLSFTSSPRRKGKDKR